MKKKDISILLNLLVIIFEITGLIISYNNMNRIAIEYYTEDSNLIALVCSTIYLIYMIGKKKIPKWLSKFKYITNINLAITFLVVLFVLIPIDNFRFKAYLIDGTMKYHHLICPILSVYSFIFFDDLCKFNKKDIYFGLIITLIYAIVMIILNIFDLVVGPYPFLMVKNQTILASVFWCITILGFSYIIAFLLFKLRTKYCN